MADKNFTLQWIPSHVGIEGNEGADDFATRDCYLVDISPLKITYSDAPCYIKQMMFEVWQEAYDLISLSKGIQHRRILTKVKAKPWFHGMKLNGNEIKILTRLRITMVYVE